MPTLGEDFRIPRRTSEVAPEKMPNSPSKMMEFFLEDLKSSLDFEELTNACNNEELGESLTRLVDKIHHVDANFDPEKVLLFARFHLLTN